jgi:6-phosphogluconolactonase
MVRVMRGLLTIMMGVSAVSPVMHAAELQAQTESVFVMTNAADKNEVIAYERASDGRFYESNRYDTGGRGSGGITDPLEAQGSLTLNPDHSLLFAVNAGSGTVSAFRIHRGALTLADKAPSGGSQPVAVAQFQDLVYVLNSGGAGSVVAFHFDDDGRLRQIKNSTVFLTATVTGGASLTISPDGKFVAVTERLANNVDTFQIKPDGKLAPIVVNPSVGPGAFSANFAPDGKLIVSETGPAGAANASAISSYSVLANGKLSVISQSVPTFGAANCWNAITRDGKYVYVSNAGSATVSGFSIGKGGVLTPVGATVVGTNPEGSTNLDIAVSGDGKYVYTLNSGAGTISIFAIEKDGTLTEAGDIQGLPKSAGFNGIAAL